MYTLTFNFQNNLSKIVAPLRRYLLCWTPSVKRPLTFWYRGWHRHQSWLFAATRRCLLCIMIHNCFVTWAPCAAIQTSQTGFSCKKPPIYQFEWCKQANSYDPPIHRVSQPPTNSLIAPLLMSLGWLLSTVLFHWVVQHTVSPPWVGNREQLFRRMQQWKLVLQKKETLNWCCKTNF